MTKGQLSPKQSCQPPQSSLLSCHETKLKVVPAVMMGGKVERNGSAPQFLAASACFSSNDQHLHESLPRRDSTICWIRSGKAAFQQIFRFCLVYGACNFRAMFRPSASAPLAMTGEPRRCSPKPSSGATGEGVKYTHTQIDLGPNGCLNPGIAPLCTLLKMIIGPWASSPLLATRLYLCAARFPLGMNPSGTRCGRYWVVVYNG